MPRDRSTWLTLSEALFELTDPSKAVEYYSLLCQGFGGPRVWRPGSGQTHQDHLHDRCSALRRELEGELRRNLIDGSVLARGYDGRQPLEGPPVHIPQERWRSLRPDFHNSSATDGVIKIAGIMVKDITSVAGDEDGIGRLTVAAEVKCMRWLKEQAAFGRKTCSKAEYFRRACDATPGLSRAAFDRVWASVAPEGWRHAGRGNRRKSTI